MRTLLRKISTGLFFKGPDQWTPNPAEARDFRMIDRALEFVDRWRLNDVEVAFAFRDREEITGVPPDKIAIHYHED